MSIVAANINAIQMSSPLGGLRVQLRDEVVVSLAIVPSRHLRRSAVKTHPVLAELRAYFNDAQHQFAVTYNVAGTPFQRRVWQALCAIPAGQTRTYGDIAKQLQSSARAVGNACRANPLPIVIPCHRVVAATHVGGYSGQTTGKQLQIKRWLLEHEGVLV